MTAFGAMTVPLPIADARPDDRTGLDDRAFLDMGRSGSIWARGETPVSPVIGPGIAAAGKAGGRPARKPAAAADGPEPRCRPAPCSANSAGQRTRPPAVTASARNCACLDEDQRMPSPPSCRRREGLYRHAGVAGIDKHRAGQIRDLARPYTGVRARKTPDQSFQKLFQLGRSTHFRAGSQEHRRRRSETGRYAEVEFLHVVGPSFLTGSA